MGCWGKLGNYGGDLCKGGSLGKEDILILIVWIIVAIIIAYFLYRWAKK